MFAPPPRVNLATPSLRDLAERLLAEEREKSAATKEPGVVNVVGRLGGQLTKLAGVAGFHSLLSRALALARTEVDWLGTISVEPDGRLAGFDGQAATSDKDGTTQGEIVLVAQLLGLLNTFIGEPLTLQLVQKAWPDISMHNEPPGKSRTP